MPQKIVIIGGLVADHDRAALIAKLKAASGPDYDWDWLKAGPTENWRPPPKLFKSFLWTIQQEPMQGQHSPKVVILHCLNGDCKNQVFRILGDDGILAPRELADGDALVVWLLAPEASLVPSREWNAGPKTTAFFCILAKLLRNRSFNKDMHGHYWTREADLLGQAPVYVDSRPEVRGEAVSLLRQMEGILLLTKGGNQGTTKKEWSIKMSSLSVVKQAFLTRSLRPFEVFKSLEPLMHALEEQPTKLYPLHSIISERVLTVCREGC